MASARYWRAVGLSAYGGGDVELSEFQLYSAGGRVDDSATLTCTLPLVSGSVANLKDDDTATVARFNPKPSGFALQWDFGSGSTADVVLARLGSSSSQALFLSHFDLQYSSDGILWTQLSQQGRFAWPGSNALTSIDTGGDDAEYENTTLLMHFEGGFTDSSFVAQTATILNGAPTFSSSIKKFGTQAGDFRRLGSISVASGMDFGTNDFTVEAWVYWNSASGVEQLGLFQLSTPGADYSTSTFSLAIYAATGGVYALYCGGNFTSSAAIPTGVWQHVAIARQSGVVRLFADGVKVHEFSNSFNFTNPGGVIGGYYSPTYNGDVLLDEFRVTKGVARYTADFTPPAAAFPDTASVGFDPIPIYAKPVGDLRTFFSEDVVGVVGAYAPTGAQRVRDIYLAGRGSITATVKEDGTPTDTPVRRKVRLFRDRDGLMVRETWSNATTGAYSFTEIDENETYSVVSYDHNDNFRAVIADRITPTVA